MLTKGDIDVPALQARVTKILTSPQSEWRIIEPEPTSVERLYKGYIVPLAAIPVLASFVGDVLIGKPVPFVGWVRVGIVQGLVGAVIAFVLALAMCYIAALVVSRLAPSFASVSDDRQALKLVAYAYTPVWVAGVLNIVPVLGLLVILAGLYSIYLFYLGIPVMMKTPSEKVIPYMAISAVIIIVIAFLIGMVTAVFTGGAMMAGAL